jgi:hypothetical protein
MIDVETARRLALALPGAEERDHRGHPSFRVRAKIFATLWPDERRVVLKLDPGEQAALATLFPAAFAPVPGGWGRLGWTNVRLDAVEPDDFRAALRSAWRSVAPKRLVEGAE